MDFIPSVSNISLQGHKSKDFMKEPSLLENKIQGQPPSGTVPSLEWKDHPSVQRLLDTIASIITEEYIAIAKQNPEVFREVKNEGGDIR